MNDEEFDKLLKSKIKEDNVIPEKINQLFSNFESEVNMKEEKTNNKKINLGNYFKGTAIAASVMVVALTGGFTYAHVNGNETIISPLLRKLGINSKYEENATYFDNEVTKDDVTIKMVDGAIDDTTLILGYEINIANNNPDNWVEVEGIYKINDMYFNPINTSIDKISDTTYMYYQVFDTDEIELDDTENVKVDAKIHEIRTYIEYETIDSVEKEYTDIFEDEWNFEETIELKNLEESQKYEFANAKSYEVIENVKLSVTEFITGSYTNILKIKTDKSNYNGDDFEKYYKILNEQGEEITTVSEEERQYDYQVYNDRIISADLDNDSKIYIEVYLKMIDEETFNKVVTIPVDLSKAVEVTEAEENWILYEGDDYNFKYEDSWTIIPEVDETMVGANSIYLGALELDIPSTTNSQNGSALCVKIIDQDTTIDEYKQQIEEENTASVSEYYEEKSASKVNFKNTSGYQITSEITDGENVYIKKDIFTVSNGKVYRVIFFGSEKEYNNIESDIDEFISNFEVID
jgi:hypothetical protein